MNDFSVYGNDGDDMIFNKYGAQADQITSSTNYKDEGSNIIINRGLVTVFVTTEHIAKNTN